MKRLAGKVAVVLGASGVGSMGPAVAKRFAEEGAQCFIRVRFSRSTAD
jgi:NAD(P)-dependent dehydrogenase (short-subunit alcohol dehydrogenase family)